MALHAAGYLAFSQGDAAAAAALLSGSLEASRAAGDRWSQAYALHGLGHVAFLQRDMQAARARYAERVALAREQGDRYGEAQGLNALGEVARYAGDLDAAMRQYTEALRLRRGLGDTRGVAMSLFNIGQVAVARGDLASARAAFDEGLLLAQELGSPYVMAVCLVGLAALAVRDGKPERAALLGGAAEAILHTLDSSLEPSDQRDYDATCAQARAALGETAFEAARAEGRRLDPVAALDSRSPAPGSMVAEHPLSPRELEVALLIAEGKTSREIADVLVITERTADTHAAHIRDKLGLRSRAEIAAWVTRQGLR
jgi:non-specific serine/threonine protein kinase